MRRTPGRPTSNSAEAVINELVESAGALLLDRGAFGTGEDAAGWDDTPYRVPHIVVTYRPPARVPEGLDRARVRRRRRASDRAGDGGCRAAGLVDEIQLHVVPVVLDGPRLLDGIDAGVSRRLRCRSTGLRSP